MQAIVKRAFVDQFTKKQYAKGDAYEADPARIDRLHFLKYVEPVANIENLESEKVEAEIAPAEKVEFAPTTEKVKIKKSKKAE